MPKFVVLAKRTEKGRTISAEANQERRKVGTEMIHDVGGEISSLYYGTGPYHFVLVVDLPDAAALAKLQVAYEALGLMEIEGYEVFDPSQWDEILEAAPTTLAKESWIGRPTPGRAHQRRKEEER